MALGARRVDRLEEVAPTPEKSDSHLADLSIGFSTGKPNVAVVRIRLLSKSVDNAPLIRSGALPPRSDELHTRRLAEATAAFAS